MLDVTQHSEDRQMGTLRKMEVVGGTTLVVELLRMTGDVYLYLSVNPVGQLRPIGTVSIKTLVDAGVHEKELLDAVAAACRIGAESMLNH